MARFVPVESFYNNVIVAAAKQPDNEVGHFNIFRVEDLRLHKDRPVSYSRRNFFKISLVIGRSNIHYADRRFAVDGPVLVFTNPQVPYFWEVLSEDQSGYVCIFTESFLGRDNTAANYPVFQQTDNAVITLQPADATSYAALLQRMYTELQGDYTYKYDLLRNLLMELIHGAQKMQPAVGSAQTGSNAAERITSIFAELLERQYPIESSSQRVQLNYPSAFAQRLNVHVNHLNKALKEATGQTTSQLIGARMVQEARILLRSTSWTIGEIAWCLGFDEPNHFSSFFKSHCKTTPRQFRNTVAD